MRFAKTQSLPVRSLGCRRFRTVACGLARGLGGSCVWNHGGIIQRQRAFPEKMGTMQADPGPQAVRLFVAEELAP